MTQREPLRDKRVAFVIANEGVEQVELTRPWEAVRQAGGTPELIAPRPGDAQGFNHLDKGDTFRVDRTTAEADASDDDAIVLPGGVANADLLRTDEHAVALVRRFIEQAKIVAAICHGPWVLVEAGAVRGRTLTSWPSLATDIENAGGTWVDEPLHDDDGLVTSRKPADLDAFCEALVRRVAEGAPAHRKAA